MINSELKILKPGILLRINEKPLEHAPKKPIKFIPGVDKNNQYHIIPNGSPVLFLGMHSTKNYVLPKILWKKKILLVLPESLDLI